MSKYENLERFMEGRPHDKEKTIVEATMEYVQQVEKTSVERHELLQKGL